MRYGRRQHDKPKNRRVIAACEIAILRFRLAKDIAARNRRALGLPDIAFVDLPDAERDLYYAGADALLAHDTFTPSPEDAAHVHYV